MTRIATIATALFALTACRSDERGTPATTDEPTLAAGGAHAPAASTFLDPGAAEPERVTRAIAVLSPTAGHETRGVVRFEEEGGAVVVTADVERLPPDVHAMHVHVYGDCSAPDGKSAGPHFHFSGSSLDPEVKIVTGNLGELRGDGGAAKHEVRLERATLHGRFSILGRAVVVHAKGNDPTQPPDGAAGARIACGVIGIDE